MPDGAPLIDPDIVAGRIGMLLQDRRPGAVKPLLAALEKLAPEHRDLTLLRVSYCCQLGDVAQALNLLRDAIAGERPTPRLHLQRAEIFFGLENYAEAAADAAEAILAAPGLTRAKSVLGLSLLKLGKFDSAKACLVESFAADPAGVDAALALAALCPEQAVQVLKDAIAATPRLGVLRNALTRRHISRGDIAAALRTAEQSRADGLADAETFCLLAVAQMQDGGWEDAAIAAARAQSLAPGKVWAVRLVDVLGRRNTGEVEPMPQRDAAAAEQILYSGGTIMPGTFRALLQESNLRGPVLDLFCGTGLNAIAAQDVSAGPWTGVEPDPVLRKFCAERGLYARLEDCSPKGFIDGTQYPVVLLNEALAYTASPQPWLVALRGAICPGGIAMAAVPTGHPGLNGHGLFAHDPDSLAGQAAQAGLVCRVARSGILRHIEGIPLHGVIACFQTV